MANTSSLPARKPRIPIRRRPETGRFTPTIPNEMQIQYDLYRIPFNGGQGRQAGADCRRLGQRHEQQFPKVSPDGRWIVFVNAATAS